MTRLKQPGRGWAYTGAIGGGAVSIAANVAHSFLPPALAPTDWSPEPGAVVGAVVWPVFLFIAVEIFARTAWPHGWSWHLLRWAGLLPVAGVAAFVSYRHLSGLLAHYGSTMFVTGRHPDKPSGWLIGWGTQLDIRTINLGTDGAITDGMVAGYLAKYATKATEATGHTSRRLTSETIDVYADRNGSHTQRLVEACWILGRDSEWAGLRRWAHMLGFGGHFLTKSRYYSVTFRLLRGERVVWRQTMTAGPEQDTALETPTVLVVNFLDFVGAGWHNTGDALLANTAAARAREQRRTALEEMTTASAN